MMLWRDALWLIHQILITRSHLFAWIAFHDAQYCRFQMHFSIFPISLHFLCLVWFLYCFFFLLFFLTGRHLPVIYWTCLHLVFVVVLLSRHAMTLEATLKQSLCFECMRLISIDTRNNRFFFVFSMFFFSLYTKYNTESFGPFQQSIWRCRQNQNFVNSAYTFFLV